MEIPIQPGIWIYDLCRAEGRQNGLPPLYLDSTSLNSTMSLTSRANSAEFFTKLSEWPASGDRMRASSLARWFVGEPIAATMGLRGDGPGVSATTAKSLEEIC